MNTIETMFVEYQGVLDQRNKAMQELEVYKEKFAELSKQLNLNPIQLLNMEVVQSELQYQPWSNKQVLHVIFEEKVTEK